MIRHLVSRNRATGVRRNLQAADDHPEQAARAFVELVMELREVIKTEDREKAERLLQHLRHHYPIPAMDILRKDVWGIRSDALILRTHGSIDISEAVRNLEATGRNVMDDDIQQLQLLASHWCAWSPTSSAHRKDSWVKYLHYSYPEVDGSLPIFDSLIWPDEIKRYPIGHVPRPPFLFLLATRDKFYVFNFENWCMMEAGNTLAKVIEGMRKNSFDEDSSWRVLQRKGNKGLSDYFPVYDDVPHTLEPHPLDHKIKEFTF